MKGIYKITNEINGKSYIGKSIHCGERFDEHCKGKQLIDKVIQVEGIENFNFEILKLVDEDKKLSYWEDYYIKKYNTIFPNGYNERWNSDKKTIEAICVLVDEEEKRVAQKESEAPPAPLIEEIISKNSMKLYALLISYSNLYNPERRIIRQRDIVLARIKRVLNLDERTIKKYWNRLEKYGLIKYCPNSWEKEYAKQGISNMPFKEQWRLRNKHKESYYEISLKEGLLFDEISPKNLIRAFEEYKLSELALKIYLTLVRIQKNYEEGRRDSNSFTYQEIRESVGYKEAWSSNRAIDMALYELVNLRLFDFEKITRINSHNLETPYFVLKQINYVWNDNYWERLNEIGLSPVKHLF